MAKEEEGGAGERVEGRINGKRRLEVGGWAIDQMDKKAKDDRRNTVIRTA